MTEWGESKAYVKTKTMDDQLELCIADGSIIILKMDHDYLC
jgi:hypothetical protein